MTKQIIRLTEQDLHKLIKESVKRYLKENENGVNKTQENLDKFSRTAKARRATQDFANAVKKTAKDRGQKLYSGVKEEAREVEKFSPYTEEEARINRNAWRTPSNPSYENWKKNNK